MALVALVLTGGIAVAVTIAGDDSTEETSAPSPAIRTSSTVTTIASTTSTVTPTTAVPRPTELQTEWAYEPYKCGVDFGVSHPYAHSSSRTYEATATVGLWSEPSTTSSLRITIPVTTYGPGGIGCPDGVAPYVTVQCKVTNGQTISSPFGTYSTWVRATHGGVTGYAPDHWIDTEWDISSIPNC